MRTMLMFWWSNFHVFINTHISTELVKIQGYSWLKYFAKSNTNYRGLLIKYNIVRKLEVGGYRI